MVLFFAGVLDCKHLTCNRLCKMQEQLLPTFQLIAERAKILTESPRTDFNAYNLPFGRSLLLMFLKVQYLPPSYLNLN